LNELQIFKNEEFGEVRTVSKDGQVYFCLADINRILEINNTSQAKARLKHDGVISNEVTDALGRTQMANFINEPNLYKLIFQSRKPSAERFTDWVTEDVLPSIRRTGTYQKPLTEKEMLRIQLNMIDDVTGRVERLENHMVIDYGQQQVLKEKVNSIVIHWLGGKDSSAYSEIAKKVFSECNRDFQHYFSVNSRNNTPKMKFEDAIYYLAHWEPCMNTKLEIQNRNAQMKLGA
jgi:prophage antirepressor-like protein